MPAAEVITSARVRVVLPSMAKAIRWRMMSRRPRRRREVLRS